MSGLSAPARGGSSGKWVTPEEGLYEAHVIDVDKVPNPYYNPETDRDNKKTQFKWTIELDESSLPNPDKEDEKWSTRFPYYTGTQLGWHARNKLTGFLRKVMKDFVYDPEANDGAGEMTSFKDLDDLKNQTKGLPLRVMTEHNIKKVDGETRVYQNAKAIMSSNKGKLSVAELMQRNLGASDVRFEDDIDF